MTLKERLNMHRFKVKVTYFKSDTGAKPYVFHLQAPLRDARLMIEGMLYRLQLSNVVYSYQIELSGGELAAITNHLLASTYRMAAIRSRETSLDDAHMVIDEITTELNRIKYKVNTPQQITESVCTS